MLEQFILVITLLLITVLVAFSISVILQIKKTAKSIEDFLKTTEGSLTPLLSALRETAERLNRITEGVEGSVKDIRHLTGSVCEIGKVIEDVNNLVRQTGASFAIKVASIGVGIKTGLNVLVKGLIKKGGERNE